MAYTQIKIKQVYREKLAKLASLNNRSMANMVEVLIDAELVGTSAVTGEQQTSQKASPREDSDEGGAR